MVQKFQDFVGQFTPVKWNVSHNLVGMKIILNYCNCILVVLFVFLFFTVQRFITHSGLPICPYKSDTLRLKTVLEYREAAIKNNWSKNVKRNIYLLSKSDHKVYSMWARISQCQFLNHLEFIDSNLLKFCISSDVKIMKSVIS